MKAASQLECLLLNYYRPQTKFAKVMFSQVSVCPQRGSLSRGGLCQGGSLSRGGGASVRETCPVRLLMGGTHPTGMHSCCECFPFWSFCETKKSRPQKSSYLFLFVLFFSENNIANQSHGMARLPGSRFPFLTSWLLPMNTIQNFDSILCYAFSGFYLNTELQ